MDRESLPGSGGRAGALNEFDIAKRCQLNRLLGMEHSAGNEQQCGADHKDSILSDFRFSQ